MKPCISFSLAKQYSSYIYIFSLNDLQCFQASWVDITHDNVFSCLQSTYFSIVSLSPFTGLPISSLIVDSVVN